MSSNCTVTLKGLNGAVAGETVSLVQSGGVGSASIFGACTLAPGGSCSVIVTRTSLGNVTLKASYVGDADNAGGTGTLSFYVYTYVFPRHPPTPC